MKSLTAEKNEHEFCLRCGRKLKNLKAREIGFGPVCLRKIKQENALIPMDDYENQLFDSLEKSKGNNQLLINNC